MAAWNPASSKADSMTPWRSKLWRRRLIFLASMREKSGMSEMSVRSDSPEDRTVETRSSCAGESFDRYYGETGQMF